MLAAIAAITAAMLKETLVLFSFVTGNSSFPQPLTEEEEKLFLKLYEQGDETAKNILIERNLRLVAHIVKKYSNIGRDADDLISIGTIGLIKAITTFDHSKGTRLATYAARCIENEILMTIRSNKKIQNQLSLQDPIGIDKEGNEISLLDILGTETDTVLDEVEKKLQTGKLYKIMDRVLKKREKVVLELRYGLSDGTVKIAQMLGISRSYVSRIEKRAIKKLSREFL
jgi:RNA polymerase sporulation-specific sigma factor